MCPTEPLQTMSRAKAEAFSEKLLLALNYGSLCLMVSTGHRTGIFHALQELPPATPEEIEKKAGLTERYVQEWLGVMFDRNSSAGINLCASKY